MTRPARTALALHIGAACLLLASAPAVAQDSPTDLDTVVVTAAGYEQTIADAPASISVITREQLQARPYFNLGDAMSELEGVVVVGGDANDADIVMRGMPGEYTLILVDGRRQSTRETMNRGTGGVQANLLPPLDAIERIEVIRGSMSSLYGSDAMGGVINVITRKQLDDWSGSFTLGGVSHEDSTHGDRQALSFWNGGPLSERASLQVWGGYQQQAEDDIYYANSRTSGTDAVRDSSIGAKLGIAVSDYQDLVIEGGQDRLGYRASTGKTIAESDPAYFDKQRHVRNHWSISHDGRWDGFDTALSLYQEIATYEMWNKGLRSPGDPELTNTVFDAVVTLPRDRHTFKAGTQYVRTRVEGIGQQDFVSGYENVASASRSLWALFVEDEYRFSDAFKLTGGLRADHADDFGTHVTPRLYANYHFAPDWTLRGGVSQGFKTPTLRQVTPGYCMTTGGSSGVRGPLCGNPDLKPEESTTSEIGVRFDREDTTFGLTVFDTRFRNRVASYATDRVDPVDPERVVYVYDNIDRVNIRGVELSAQREFGRDWRVSGNYTFTDSERQGGGEPSFDGSSLDGRPLDKTPRHVAFAKVDWQASERIGAYLSGRYTGEQYWAGFRNGASNVRERPGATTFDLGTRWTISPNLSVNAAVLNFTDQVVAVDDRSRFDGLDGNWLVDQGRRYWLSLNITY